MGFVDSIIYAIKYLVYAAIVGVIAVVLFFIALSLLAVARVQNDTFIAGIMTVVALGIIIGLYLAFRK